MMPWFSDNQCISINVKEILILPNMPTFHYVKLIENCLLKRNWENAIEIKQWREIEILLLFLHTYAKHLHSQHQLTDCDSFRSCHTNFFSIHWLTFWCCCVSLYIHLIIFIRELLCWWHPLMLLNVSTVNQIPLWKGTENKINIFYSWKKGKFNWK